MKSRSKSVTGILSDLKGEIEGLMSNVVSLIRSWTEGLGGGGKASACHN